MEKASRKLNSIKLVSGNNSELGEIVTGIRTKLSPEWEEQKENYHPFLQKKKNFLLEKKYSKGKFNSRKSSISVNAWSKSSTQEANNVQCMVSCTLTFQRLLEPVYRSSALHKALEIFPPIICSEFSLYIFEQLA